MLAVLAAGPELHEERYLLLQRICTFLLYVDSSMFGFSILRYVAVYGRTQDSVGLYTVELGLFPRRASDGTARSFTPRGRPYGSSLLFFFNLLMTYTSTRNDSSTHTVTDDSSSIGIVCRSHVR